MAEFNRCLILPSLSSSSVKAFTVALSFLFTSFASLIDRTSLFDSFIASSTLKAACFLSLLRSFCCFASSVFAFARFKSAAASKSAAFAALTVSFVASFILCVTCLNSVSRSFWTCNSFDSSSDIFFVRL